MKLLIDMNLSPRWANLLTEAGIKAVHWSAIGAANSPDVEIVAFAAGSPLPRLRLGVRGQGSGVKHSQGLTFWRNVLQFVIHLGAGENNDYCQT